MELANKKFLVVGASGVLGAELTRQLRAKGAEVMGTASSNDSAAKIPSVAEVRLLLDLTQPESITTLTDYLVAASGSGRHYQRCGRGGLWPSIRAQE